MCLPWCTGIMEAALDWHAHPSVLQIGLDVGSPFTDDDGAAGHDMIRKPYELHWYDRSIRLAHARCDPLRLGVQDHPQTTKAPQVTI